MVIHSKPQKCLISGLQYTAKWFVKVFVNKLFLPTDIVVYKYVL